MEVLHLAGALMEYFLEGIALLRHWYINQNTKALTEHFLQGNVPLMHLLNAKPLLISCWRSAFNEVNDYILGPNFYKNNYCFFRYRETNSKSWNWIELPVNPPDARVVKIHNLTPRTKYEFQVTSFNEFGDGMYSQIIEAQTKGKNFVARKICLAEQFYST